MKLYKCTVCGYVHRGDEAPEKCPKCGASKEKFELLDEKATDLIEKSRETNDIHMEIFTLLDKVSSLAKRGAEINLDPGCYKIFSEVINFTDITNQEILAEINGHVNKGKWN